MAIFVVYVAHSVLHNAYYSYCTIHNMYVDAAVGIQEDTYMYMSRDSQMPSSELYNVAIFCHHIQTWTKTFLPCRGWGLGMD